MKKICLLMVLIYFSANTYSQTRIDYYKRGLAAQKAQKFDDAILDYTKAIKSNPQNAHAYYMRGESNEI